LQKTLNKKQMESLRGLVKELEDAINEGTKRDIISEVDRIKEGILSLMDDIESVVTDANDAIEDMNKSVHIDLDDIESELKEVSKSLY
jgi:archaellum component FlaC